ncbi:MAG: homoserine O-acetyltransferase [Ignavibacteria bacterium]|nr:MAG: homoserine O-acetyltransferase [Ignavibacteria bacterium]
MKETGRIDRENKAKAKTNFITLFTESDYIFDSGERLNNIQVAFQTYGELNASADNVILVCHALTGNSHAAGVIDEEEIENCRSHEFLSKYNRMYFNKPGWWDPLIGPGKLFDTNRYYVICSNIIGSCYGSSGPASINESGNKFNLSFPKTGVRDMVRIQKELLDQLNIKKIKTVVGGSLGGMQVLEWALLYPKMIESIIPVATSAAHSPWAIGLNKIAKDAIRNDPAWQNGNYTIQPLAGLSLARQAAMLSYRSMQSFNAKFGRLLQQNKSGNTDFSVVNYLNYQGEKLVNRFDANSYLYLADAMDDHDISKKRGELNEVLNSIDLPTLCIGIDSDILYPADEQKMIAKHIKNSEYKEIKSLHGHDAFLIEFEQMEKLIKPFLDKYIS